MTPVQETSKMNRLRKEQIKAYLRLKVPTMSLQQQRAFIIMFAPEPDWMLDETIEFINGKVLRRAYKHVVQMTRGEST